MSKTIENILLWMNGKGYILPATAANGAKFYYTHYQTPTVYRTIFKVLSVFKIIPRTNHPHYDDFVDKCSKILDKRDFGSDSKEGIELHQQVFEAHFGFSEIQK